MLGGNNVHQVIAGPPPPPGTGAPSTVPIVIVEGVIKAALASNSSLELPPIPLDTLLVDQETAKELQCAICLQLLTNPKQCKNGHLFCYSCISQFIERTPECPQCRCQLREPDLSRSLFVERHIRLLKVWCKYHFLKDEESKDNWIEDKEGCTEIFQLENVLKHEKQCGFAPVQCKFSLHCGKIRRRDVDAHERKCPFRPLECNHCKLNIEYSKMEEHLKECTMLPVKCLKCSLDCKKNELEIHKTTACLEEIAPCPFASQGCTVKQLRKTMKEHLAEDCGYHLQLMKLELDAFASVKQEFDAQLKIRDERIKQLEKTLSDIDTKIEWRVKNWATTKKKSYLQSDKFTFGEFTWFIGFYTDGDNDESRGFVSVYLFLDVNNLPKGKNVTIEFVLKFLNHKDPNESVKKEFKATFPIKGGQGWGDRKAIRSSRISEEVGFLKQDALHLEASISIKKVHWLLH